MNVVILLRPHTADCTRSLTAGCWLQCRVGGQESHPPWNNTHLFFVSATPALARGTRDARDANDDAGQFGIESRQGEIMQMICD